MTTLRRSIGRLAGLGLIRRSRRCGHGRSDRLLPSNPSPADGAACSRRCPGQRSRSAASRAAVQQAAAQAAAAAPAVPQYDHVMVVIMENHSADNILANPAAPYINSLAATGASMTQSYARHPPEPAQLRRPVLRLHPGRGRRFLPRHLPGRQSRRPTVRGRQDLRRLLGNDAQRGVHRVRQRHVRPQAQSVGRLQQRPRLVESTVDQPADRLGEPADRVDRRAQSDQRHARRHRRAGRHLAARSRRRLPAVGKGPQQPADPDL